MTGRGVVRFGCLLGLLCVVAAPREATSFPGRSGEASHSEGEATGWLIAESNGMAEAFVKTFKRDYVYLAELHNADEVLRALTAWFDDYNEHHPHRGLGMRSPRQYRALLLAAA